MIAVKGAGYNGSNALVAVGTGGAFPSTTKGVSNPINVVAGETLCLVGYIDGSQVTAGLPRWLVTDTAVTTASTTTTGSHTLPVATLNVGSTTGFQASGAINVGGQIITYTGKTSTTFTGCSGGAGTVAAGTVVDTIYAQATQQPGLAGFVFDYFDVPATLLNQVKVVADANQCTATNGQNVIWSNERLHEGHEPTDYDDGALDDNYGHLIDMANLHHVGSDLPDPTGLTATITAKGDVQLAWSYSTAPTALPIDFAHFEIRTAATDVGWANATFVHNTKQLQFLVTDAAAGTPFYYVGTVGRAAGQTDPSPGVGGAKVQVTVVAPNDVSSLTGGITNKGDLLLKWTAPTNLYGSSGGFPSAFSHYEIWSNSTNNLGSATLIGTAKHPQFIQHDPATGANTYYWVLVVDRAKRKSAGTGGGNPVQQQVSAPSDVSSLAAAVTKKQDVLLTWTPPAAFGWFSNYEIRDDNNPGVISSHLLGKTKQHKFLVTDPAVGSVTYYVFVMDRAGHYSAGVNIAKDVGRVFGNGKASDIQTGAVTLVRDQYLTVAKLTYAALIVGDELHFKLAANLALTGVQIGASPDEIDWIILQADTASVGSAIAGSSSPTTTCSGVQTLSGATITVASTTSFASSGYIVVGGQLIAYTGKTSTTFTGCTGGVGSSASNAAVGQAVVISGPYPVKLSAGSATTSAPSIHATAAPHPYTSISGDDSSLSYSLAFKIADSSTSHTIAGNTVAGTTKKPSAWLAVQELTT